MMKRAFSASLALLIIAAAPLVCPTVTHSQSLPRILSAKLEGKKLTVTGQNFALGAVIIVDRLWQTTRNSQTNPGEVLIAKKGGKRIRKNQIVTLQVMNSPDALSNEFNFFGGLTLTFADNGKTIRVSKGDQFLLALGGNFNWSLDLIDQSKIVAVPTLIAIPGSQGVFEAVSTGKVTITAFGAPNCQKCIDPPAQFAVTLLID
jgi:hypothetical protein